MEVQWLLNDDFVVVVVKVDVDVEGFSVQGKKGEERTWHRVSQRRTTDVTKDAGPNATATPNATDTVWQRLT